MHQEHQRHGLRYCSISDVVVSPLFGIYSDNPVGGAQFPEDGPDYLFERRKKNERRIPLPSPERQSNIKRFDDAAIYGGPIWGHFGHFMAEGVHRLWLALDPEFSDLPILFVQNGK